MGFEPESYWSMDQCSTTWPPILPPEVVLKLPKSLDRLCLARVLELGQWDNIFARHDNWSVVSTRNNQLRTKQCSFTTMQQKIRFKPPPMNESRTKKWMNEESPGKKSLKLNKNRQILKYFWLLNWKGGGMKFILRSACSISSLSLSLSLSRLLTLCERGWVGGI